MTNLFPVYEREREREGGGGGRERNTNVLVSCFTTLLMCH